MRLLEQRGFITRYVALVDPAEVGMSMTFFARAWLTGQDEDTVNSFVDAVKSLPQIVEFHLMAGDCDFLLRVVGADIDAYRRFQAEHLGRIKGVQSIKTEIPMQKIKQTTAIPV